MQGVGTWWVMNHASLWEKQSHYKVKIVFGLITKVLNYIWSLKKNHWTILAASDLCLSKYTQVKWVELYIKVIN